MTRPLRDNHIRSNPHVAPFRQYTIRVLIFTVIFIPVLTIGILISLTTVIPDSFSVKNDAQRLKDWARAEMRRMEPDSTLRNDPVRLRLTDALTSSPEIHYRMSIEEERNGNLEKALDEIELGLGLVELHPRNKVDHIKYESRREQLKRRIAARVEP